MTFLKKSNGTTRAVVPSSGTYNALVEAVSGGRFSRGAQLKAGDRTLITVYNAGVNDINYGDVVALQFWKGEDRISYAAIPAWLYKDADATAKIKNPPWGLAAETIPVGEIGIVQVTGFAIVRFGVYGDENWKQYVVPNSNGDLAVSDTGSARLLAWDKNGYAAILLNAGAGASDGEYYGEFAVHVTDDKTLHITGGRVKHDTTGSLAWLGFSGKDIEITEDTPDGEYNVYAVPYLGGIDVFISKYPMLFAFANLAYVRIEEGLIVEKRQIHTGSIIYKCEDFTVLPYNATSVVVYDGPGAGNTPYYLEWENGEIAILGNGIKAKLDVEQDGYVIFNLVSKKLRYDDNIHLSGDYPVALVKYDTTAGITQVTQIRTNLSNIRADHLYTGKFAILKVGLNEILVRGGDVRFGYVSHSIDDTYFTVESNKDVYVVLRKFGSEYKATVELRNNAPERIGSEPPPWYMVIGAVRYDSEKNEISSVSSAHYGTGVTVVGRIL